jgi:hypothetical protein
MIKNKFPKAGYMIIFIPKAGYMIIFVPNRSAVI